MRNIAIIALSILTIFITSCNNDLELLGDGGQLPVVYGIINMSDSATYIRVEKSFADPNISPMELAKDPSNLYYDNILVQLYDEKNPTERFDLKRVDGNKEGYVRDEGAFAQVPNYLYKIKNDKLGFKKGSNVVLEILDADNDSLIAFARTVAIGKVTIQYPTIGSVAGSLRLLPGDVMKIRLQSGVDASGLVSFYIGSLSYVVKAYDRETGKMIKRMPQQIYTNQYKSQYDIDFLPSSLYKMLGESLERNPNHYHRIDSVYVQVDCFGKELNEYKEIQLLNSGITSSSVIPVYNNIENGRGLLSAGSTDKSGPFALAFITLDSLNKYDETQGLNFRP